MKLKAHVKPNQRQDSMAWDGEMLHIKISAVPKDGAANRHLVEYAAKEFGVAKSSISILNGQTSAYKTLEVNASEAEMKVRLAKLPQIPQNERLF